jgi:hypothetical protein
MLYPPFKTEIVQEPGLSDKACSVWWCNQFLVLENLGIVDALLMSDVAIAVSQFQPANSIFD